MERSLYSTADTTQRTLVSRRTQRSGTFDSTPSLRLGKRISLCGRYLKGNPKHFMACVTSLLLTCGEVVLRKSVYSNMYHYRWFLIQIISIITFLGFAAYAMGRYLLDLLEDNKSSTASEGGFLRRTAVLFRARKAMRKNKSYPLLDEPLLQDSPFSLAEPLP